MSSESSSFWSRTLFARVLLVVCCRGSCWLFEPAVYEISFHRIPFRGVFRCGKPGSVWLQVGVEVVLPPLGWSSLFAVTFLLR